MPAYKINRIEGKFNKLEDKYSNGDDEFILSSDAIYQNGIFDCYGLVLILWKL